MNVYTRVSTLACFLPDKLKQQGPAHGPGSFRWGIVEDHGLLPNTSVVSPIGKHDSSAGAELANGVTGIKSTEHRCKLY